MAAAPRGVGALINRQQRYLLRRPVGRSDADGPLAAADADGQVTQSVREGVRAINDLELEDREGRLRCCS